MRTIDESKKQRIDQAVLEIVMKEGLSNLSFGKIAKQAKVSSGTPYVYYQDKEDMLASLYLRIKQRFDQGMESITSQESIEKSLRDTVLTFAQRMQASPLEANYMFEIQANPEFISEKAYEEGNRLAKPIFDLYERAIREQVVVTDKLEFLNALLFAPLQWHLKNNQSATEREIATLVTLSVNSVLKST